MNSLVNFSRGGVDDALARELRDHRVPDGVHQVGLAQTDAAVQEQRVVGVPRPLRDRQRGGMGEAIGRADDEVGERVARVEVGRAALAPDGWARADCGVASDAGPTGPAASRLDRRRGLAGGVDDELDLDAVADDPGQRLGDQGPVAVLQPVLGEAVRDGDPEARCRRPRPDSCRAARSRSSRVTGTPGARRGRRARLASASMRRCGP